MSVARFDWRTIPKGQCHMLDFARHIELQNKLEFNSYFDLQRWEADAIINDHIVLNNRIAG